MAKSVAKSVSEIEKKTDVLEKVQDARIEKFYLKVAKCDQVLQTVILYGDKTNYFREVNEFIKKKNHY